MSKHITRRAVLQGALSAPLAFSSVLPALAQSAAAYPARPVTLVAPFPAGGVTDAMMRRISERFQQITGQPLLILNKPGRTNALVQLAGATPDGYTLSMTGRSQLINHWVVGSQLPYKAVDDFSWITTMVTSYFGLFVNARSNIKSVADLIAAAKQPKANVTYATSFGVGGITHAPMYDLDRQANANMAHIPYKGDSEAVRALLGNEVTAIVAAGATLPLVDDGRLRLLAWVSAERHPRYPDVPTLKELGYNVEAYSIVGLGGPKGMDPALVNRIAALFKQIITEPAMHDYLMSLSQKPTIIGPDEFGRWAREQLPKERESLARFGLLAKE